jgi:calcineurin-like phosphoesterase family protein
MTTFFTSDTHFGHANIIKYTGRPFANVEEMDEALIANWNARVTRFDHVFHLGDFGWKSRAHIAAVRARLSGKITLVLGNHDRSRTAMLECGFEEVYDEAMVTISGRSFALVHHAGYVPHGDVLCGHVHEKWRVKRYATTPGVVHNVGVDVRGYRPVTLEEILQEDEEESEQ